MHGTGGHCDSSKAASNFLNVMRNPSSDGGSSSPKPDGHSNFGRTRGTENKGEVLVGVEVLGPRALRGRARRQARPLARCRVHHAQALLKEETVAVVLDVKGFGELPVAGKKV